MRKSTLEKIVADYAAELKNNSKINQYLERLSANNEDRLLSHEEAFFHLQEILKNTVNASPSFRDFCRTNELAMPAYVAQILYNKSVVELDIFLACNLYVRSMNSRYPELTAYAYANFFKHQNGKINPDAIDELISELCREEVKLPCFVGNEILIDPDVFHVTKPLTVSKWAKYNPIPYEYIISLLDVDPNFLREPLGLRTAFSVMRNFGTWGAGILLSSENLFSLLNSLNYSDTVNELKILDRLIPFYQCADKEKVTEIVSVLSKLNYPTLKKAEQCIELTNAMNYGWIPSVQNWGFDGSTPLHRVAECGYAPLAIRLLDAGVDVNARNPEGKTPLHLASEDGSVEIVNYLLMRGADYKITDNAGRTALDYVQEKITLLDQKDEKIKERYQSIFLHLSAQIPPARPQLWSFLFQSARNESEELVHDANTLGSNAPTL